MCQSNQQPGRGGHVLKLSTTTSGQALKLVDISLACLRAFLGSSGRPFTPETWRSRSSSLEALLVPWPEKSMRKSSDWPTTAPTAERAGNDAQDRRCQRLDGDKKAQPTTSPSVRTGEDWSRPAVINIYHGKWRPTGAPKRNTNPAILANRVKFRQTLARHARCIVGAGAEAPAPTHAFSLPLHASALPRRSPSSSLDGRGPIDAWDRRRFSGYFMPCDERRQCVSAWQMAVAAITVLGRKGNLSGFRLSRTMEIR